jgi:nucleotide-binding universal stress UspA family protein
MYRRFLIATDGSELAEKAVTSGLTLAKELGTQVVVVTATEPWTTMTNGEGRRRRKNGDQVRNRTRQ